MYFLYLQISYLQVYHLKDVLGKQKVQTLAEKWTIFNIFPDMKLTSSKRPLLS